MSVRRGQAMNRWSKGVVASFVLALASLGASTRAQVVINEIHYNPTNANAEFFELYNRGASPVNVGNWSMANAVSFTLPPGTTIPAGGYLVMALSPATLQAETGYAGAIAWNAGGNLSNGGEIMTLRDAGLGTVDEVTYDDAAPWPLAPDGSGPSLELKNPALDNSLGAS